MNTLTLRRILFSLVLVLGLPLLAQAQEVIAAKSFGKALRDKTQSLAQHPELGRKGRPGLPDWLRELVVHPNYIVFYRVLADARTVQILRVKHVAQQVP